MLGIFPSFRFESPEFLWLLLLLPLIAIWLGRRGKAAAIEYSSVETLKRLGATRKTKAGRWLSAMRLLALAFVIIALARPQTGETREEVEASGIDIILAIDVSGSMRALDFRLGNKQASRLEVVKKVVRDFINERPDDRLGIVAFAEYPYLVSPPTLDHDFLLRNLERVRIDEENAQTAIGSGLASSVNRLRDTKGKSKVVILLTDGKNNAGKIAPLTAAEAAEAIGVKVYTIGAGSDGLVPIPVNVPGGGQRLTRDYMPIDEDTLQEISKMTGGRFFRAHDTKSLSRVYGEIDALERTTAKRRQFENYHDHFAWALVPALFLIFSELGLVQTRLRRLP